MKAVTDTRPVVGKSPDDFGYMSLGPGDNVLKRAFAIEERNGKLYKLYKYDFSGGFWNPITCEPLEDGNHKRGNIAFSREEAERRLLRYVEGPEFLRD